MSWNYAELSKMAKAHGGPEALVDTLIQNGVSKGKESMYPIVAIAFVAGAAVWEGSKFVWKKLCSLGKERPSEAEVQLAREELIQEINKYDAEHQESSEENNAE